MRHFPIATYLLILFFFTLLAAYAHGVSPQGFDITLLNIVQGWQTSLLDQLMDGVAFIGETWPSIILAGFFVLWFWLKGYRREALGLVAALVAISLIGSMGKVIIDRTRPDGDQFSFVSGHTAYFTVLTGYLYYYISKVLRDSRWLGVWRAGLVLLLVLTAISRLYLNAHWPTDVLGGFLLGILILIPVMWRLENTSVSQNLI
ncbi:membrane-associated phospholipid phosphatase [Dehalogenimonas sp. WBC-2]|nr:membrane-associated phospholipid phosphatase [Dehalogenimonas sp. WBC-2]